MSQSTFVFAFVLRLILIFLVNTDFWPDYNRDFNVDDWLLWKSFMFPLQFLIYNIIPIGILLYLHAQNFGSNNEHQQAPLTSDQNLVLLNSKDRDDFPHLQMDTNEPDYYPHNSNVTERIILSPITSNENTNAEVTQNVSANVSADVEFDYPRRQSYNMKFQD